MQISKKTQTIIGVVAVGLVGYYIWKKNNRDNTWAEASGTRRSSGKKKATRLVTCTEEDCSGASANLCGESCMNGTCNVAVYGATGNITHYVTNQPCPRV